MDGVIIVVCAGVWLDMVVDLELCAESWGVLMPDLCTGVDGAVVKFS